MAHHPHKRHLIKAFMRDEASLSQKYIKLDDEQELFLRFLAFKAASRELKRGYFKSICDNTTRRSHEVGTEAKTFGARGSEERLLAQCLLHIYIKCLGRTLENLTRPPRDFCPYSFLTPDPNLAIQFTSSLKHLHTSSPAYFTPVIRNRTMSKTPPPPFKQNNMQNTEANHEIWELLTDPTFMNCIPLLQHSDPSHEAGYGPEHNYPGVHCLMQDATDSVGAVQRQMNVFYKTTIADFLLIKGKLSPGCNGIHIQVPVVSPLAFSHIEKMNEVSASQMFMHAVLFSSCILSHWRYTSSSLSSTR